MYTLIFYKLFGCWIIYAKTASKYLKENKCQGKRRKRALQRKLTKDAKKCRNINDMFKRWRTFSVVFELFSRLYVIFLSFKKISRQPIWNLAGQKNSRVFLSDSYVISATNKPMKLQPKGVACVEDVEFSKNISEDQSNNSKLFSISPFIDFVQFSIYSMCNGRMWTLSLLLVIVKPIRRHRFPFPNTSKWGHPPSKKCS